MGVPVEHIARFGEAHTEPSEHTRVARRPWVGEPLWRLRRLVDMAAALVSVAVLAHPGHANWAYALVVIAVLRRGEAYRRPINVNLLDHLPRLLLPVAVGLLAISLASPLLHLEGSFRNQAAVLALAIVVGRALSHAAILSARRRGRMAEPTLIVGAGAVGVELFSLLHTHREYGLLPVGILDDVAHEPSLRPIGGLADLERIVDLMGVRRVIVAFGPGAEHEMVRILRRAVQLDVEVHVVPRFFEVGLSQSGPDVEHQPWCARDWRGSGRVLSLPHASATFSQA